MRGKASARVPPPHPPATMCTNSPVIRFKVPRSKPQTTTYFVRQSTVENTLPYFTHRFCPPWPNAPPYNSSYPPFSAHALSPVSLSVATSSNGSPLRATYALLRLFEVRPRHALHSSRPVFCCGSFLVSFSNAGFETYIASSDIFPIGFAPTPPAPRSMWADRGLNRRQLIHAHRSLCREALCFCSKIRHNSLNFGIHVLGFRPARRRCRKLDMSLFCRSFLRCFICRYLSFP